MTGISDGVSKLWVMRCDRGLDLHGVKDELEAIDHLVRCALLKDVDKDVIRHAVEHALKHLDEPDHCVACGSPHHTDCGQQ
jgi:hypothetical protein